MIADISTFLSLANPNPILLVCNSDAAVLLQKYDNMRSGMNLCARFIEEMNGEKYVPADLISKMYESRERYELDLFDLKQQIMEQVAKEPFDAFDRKVFMGLSKESQDALRDVVAADEVFQRALEMKEEATDAGMATGASGENMPPETGGAPAPGGGGAMMPPLAPVGGTTGGGAGTAPATPAPTGGFDDYAFDVASEE